MSTKDRNYDQEIRQIATITCTSLGKARRACHEALMAAKHERLICGFNEERPILFRQPPKMRFGLRQYV